MQLISSKNPPEPRRRAASKAVADGKGSWVTSFMGRPKGSGATDAAGVVRPGPEQIYPMGFIVEQDPESVLGAHFHTVDQFQVFMVGDGTLAIDPVKSITVQFVSPFTPYGPIAAGREGLSYFTLRNGWDGGAKMMPEKIHELPPRPRKFRQLLGEGMPVSNDELAAVKELSVAPVIESTEDGVGAWLYRIPAGGSVTGPNPATGRGQHWVVVGGSLEQDGDLLEPFSCGFLPPDETAFTAKAGPGGLAILAMQYPLRPDLAH